MQSIGQSLEGGQQNKTPQERSLEERKLDYVHLSNDAQPRSQSSVSVFYVSKDNLNSEPQPLEISDDQVYFALSG